MSVTTLSSPELQARLKAAIACLNLSLEAELTQYRCHRLVQSLSPFPATTNPEPDIPVHPLTPTAPNQPEPLSPVPEAVMLATVSPELPGQLESPQDVTVHAAFETSFDPSFAEAFDEVAWSVPIPPEDILPSPVAAPQEPEPNPSSPAKVTPAAPTQVAADTVLLSEVPTIPRPVESRFDPRVDLAVNPPALEFAPEPTSPAPEVSPEVDEPDVDEAWFDLGEFQPFPSSETTPLQQIPDDEFPSFRLTDDLENSVSKSEPDHQAASLHSYLDSATALLENVPNLEQPTPEEPEPDQSKRLLLMACVMGCLVSVTGAVGFIWWQSQPQSSPLLEQFADVPAPTEPESLPNPPLQATGGTPTNSLPEDAAAPLAPTAPPIKSPGAEPSLAPLSSQPMTKTNSAQAAVQAMPTPDASPLVAPPGSSQFFYVIAPYQQVQDLTQARQAIPNAYLVEFPEGVMIQFAAFEDEPSALFLVDSLVSQGIQAKVRAPES